MKPPVHLKSLLSATGEDAADRLAIFAMVNLFLHGLSVMRALCLKLIEDKQLVA
ncbi:MAG: hypothetical protein ACHRXM_25640 [Isosphaerales bacterium]